jgi:hypothetical protein
MTVLDVRFDAHADVDLLSRRLDEAVALGARSVLVFAGDGVPWPAEAVSPLLQRQPVPVFGGVFPQVVHGTEHTETGLVVIALGSQAQVCVVDGLDDDAVDFAAALQAVGAEHRSVLVIVDGLSRRIARFVEAVFDQVGGGPAFMGGGAGSLSFRQRPCVITPEGLRQGVGLVVALDLPLGIGVDHGWTSIAGPFVATRTDGNAVRQLDYRSAAAVYRACVEPHAGATLTPENFFDHAKGYPFGIQRFDGSLLVRDPIVMNDDALVCVGEVPEQTVLRILRGDATALVTAARNGTAAALTALGRPPGGALLVDCISRVLFLGDRFGEELTAAQDRLRSAAPGARPLAGALTLGEIANDGSHCLEFYNKTFVLGAYPDA